MGGTMTGRRAGLNPVEGSWCYLKRVPLRNGSCRILRQLRDEIRLATANLRHEAEGLANRPKPGGYQR